MIHYFAKRWSRTSACGIERRLLLRGSAHVTFTLSRATCEACLKAVGELH